MHGTSENPAGITIAPSWRFSRKGSLSGAARSLGLTQPTLGRQIDALETALGQRLFTRSTEGLGPTEAARRIGPHAMALRDTAAALRRVAAASDQHVAGTVRITCSEVVGIEVLPEILAGLQGRHPELSIELVPSDSIQDLLHRGADLAVRMAEPRQAALLRRRVGTIPLGLFAHPDYAARRGLPRTVRELKQHAIIGFDRERAYIREMLRRGLPIDRSLFAFRSDSTLAQLAAIRAGLGIGFCQVPLASRVPALVPVLSGLMRADLPTWVAMHEDLKEIPRYRVTFDALAAGLQAYLADPVPAQRQT